MKIAHAAVFEGELQLSLTGDWLPWSSGKLVEIKIEGDRVLCSSYSTSCVSLQCGKWVQIKKKVCIQTQEVHFACSQNSPSFTSSRRLLLTLLGCWWSYRLYICPRTQYIECCPCLSLPSGTQEEWLRSIKYGSRLSFRCLRGFQKHIFARCWSVTRVSLWQTSLERPKPSSAHLWVHHRPAGVLIGPVSCSVFWLL